VSKIVLFGLLVYLTGNPILAIIVMLVILYLLDQRFLGLTPSVLRPFQLRRRASRLRQELRGNLHDTSAKLDLARTCMLLGRYGEAQRYLEEMLVVMSDSADVHAELGLCALKLGDAVRGETLLLQALELNPRVKYGEPYLRLGEAFAATDLPKAVAYIERFREEHSSSCEAYYRLGRLYEQLGRREDAKRAYGEALDIYRGLPRYSRRRQRRWALLARLR